MEDKKGLAIMKPLEEEKEENWYAYDFPQPLILYGIALFTHWRLRVYDLDIVSSTYNGYNASQSLFLLSAI